MAASGGGPNQTLRENGQRRIVVQANGDGLRDMAAVVAELVGRLAAPLGKRAVVASPARTTMAT